MGLLAHRVRTCPCPDPVTCPPINMKILSVCLGEAIFIHLPQPLNTDSGGYVKFPFHCIWYGILIFL